MANQETQREIQYGVILPADLGLADIVTFTKEAEELGFRFVAAYGRYPLN